MQRQMDILTARYQRYRSDGHGAITAAVMTPTVSQIIIVLTIIGLIIGFVT